MLFQIQIRVAAFPVELLLKCAEEIDNQSDPGPEEVTWPLRVFIGYLSALALLSIDTHRAIHHRS